MAKRVDEGEAAVWKLHKQIFRQSQERAEGGEGNGKAVWKLHKQTFVQSQGEEEAGDGVAFESCSNKHPLMDLVEGSVKKLIWRCSLNIKH